MMQANLLWEDSYDYSKVLLLPQLCVTFLVSSYRYALVADDALSF